VEAEWSWSTLSLHRSHWVEVEILVTCTTGGEEETHLNKRQKIYSVLDASNISTLLQDLVSQQRRSNSWPNRNETERTPPSATRSPSWLVQFLKLSDSVTILSSVLLWLTLTGGGNVLPHSVLHLVLAHTNLLWIFYYPRGEMSWEVKQINLGPDSRFQPRFIKDSEHTHSHQSQWNYSNVLPTLMTHTDWDHNYSMSVTHHVLGSIISAPLPHNPALSSSCFSPYITFVPCLFCSEPFCERDRHVRWYESSPVRPRFQVRQLLLQKAFTLLSLESLTYTKPQAWPSSPLLPRLVSVQGL